MAKKVIVQLVDDIDGTVATETVSFGLDGIQYEIDLSAERAAELRGAFEKWVGKARRISGRKATRGRVAGNSDAARIREWARSQGIEVSDRGRVPADIRERFEREAG